MEKEMITFDWKPLVSKLKSMGIDACYQQSVYDDESDPVNDEVAIYDKSGEVQLYYITDDEMVIMNDNKNGDYNLDEIKAEVLKVLPNIKFNLK